MQSNRRWVLQQVSADCESLARELGVPPIIAQLLANRGVAGTNDGRTFLNPVLKDLLPPHHLHGAVQAGKLLAEAIRDIRRIVLYGDYDVDGITGAAILWHALRHAGAEVSCYVPHRVEEGYGINVEAVRRLVADGAQMIVSVDCGITAVASAEFLRDAGVPLIVTDHHTPQQTLPAAAAIVHPGLGGESGNPDLSGSGVAFKTAWAFLQAHHGAERLPPAARELLMELLPLAALGTTADVVPLCGENRLLVKHGLEALPRSRLAGIQALIQSAGLANEKIRCYDVGFKLGPRINAAGRMGHARLAVELFTSAGEARAREIALYLEDHNRARQGAERKHAHHAFEMIERGKLAGDAKRAIVLASEGWHPGVIGIVAARVVDRYHRPAILIALNNGEGQGSARSIARFDLSAALEECADHLLNFGGHAMAAGLRIAAGKVEDFTRAFVNRANRRLTGDDLIPRLRIDAEVCLSSLTLSVAEAVAGMGPFGVGNPKPMLSTNWLDVAAEPRCVGAKGEHLQVALRQNGLQLKGIGFGLASHAEDLKLHRRCRVAFEPIVNEFNGRKSVELQIADFQFPGGNGQPAPSQEGPMLAM